MNRRYLYTTVLAVILPLSLVFAQEQRSVRDRAAAYIQRYDYARAAEIYGRLASVKEPRFGDMEGAANSYFQMRDFSSAEIWYAKVVEHPDHKAEHLLRYADLLKANGKYKEAQAQYRTYAEQTGKPAEVALKIAGCDSALVWIANPKKYILRNEEAVNTTASEFSVSVLGNTAYYAGEQVQGAGATDTYGWTGRPFLKVYQTKADQQNALSVPSLVHTDINDPRFHVGPVASPDGGKTLYVTRTYTGKEYGKEIEGGKKYRTHRLELYRYEQQDGKWIANPFAYNDPDNYSVGHAAFSPDGKILYFVSDRPDGHGGTDIWYAEHLADGTWGVPVNAGPAINTAGDERFPVIAADGQLYYSTDGLAGMGGLDIFTSKGSKANWVRPVNMGYPINSGGDDFSFVTVKDDQKVTTGYLSSNREGGKGNDDIYSFSFAKPQPKPKPEPIVLILQGVVTNKNNGQRLSGAKIILNDGTRTINGSSKGNGTFEFVLEQDKQYRVHGSLDKFYPDSARTNTLRLAKSDTLRVALALEPVLSVGKTFVLENLYYDFDKHNIRPDAALILDELVQTMRDNPTLKIELSSHTDSRGNDAYNLALSQRRAKAAVDYIISKGISKDRLEAKGYGETRLVNECANGVKCTDEQHQANRRTEVKVLDI